MDNNYIENRFGHFREKTTEELEEKLADLIDERENDLMTFNSPKSSSEQRSEAHKDIIFDEEQISYIEDLLKERKGPKR